MQKKGFLFSMEAAITLLLASIFISSIQYLHLPTYSDIFLLELIGDFQQLAAKEYYSEFSDFSKGDPFAKMKLENAFSKLINRLGDYCLIIEMKSNSMNINCINKNELNFNRMMPSNRLFFNGDEFLELKMVLLV